MIGRYMHPSSMKKKKRKKKRKEPAKARLSPFAFPRNSPFLNGDTYGAPNMHHTIFIRVSVARRISREEEGISYVFPCIFPILLEQVNGKRALPCPSFVFHEMSSSRIESLCRDTFARCVIRSPLLLVKEPPVAVAFSRCKRRYISKGAQYR